MSARRCNGCGESVRNPHRAGCSRGATKSPANFASAESLEQLRKVVAFPLPPAPERADLLEAERTLMAFYRPAGGDT